MKNPEQLENLYHAVNRMMMRLGADGEITATSNEAGEVMTALSAIDSGVYNNKFALRVHVTWKDRRHDWPWFYLIGGLGSMVHLKGADFPDGSVKHRGDSFWVHSSEIKEMVDHIPDATKKP